MYYLVCVLFGTAIPTSMFNLFQLFFLYFTTLNSEDFQVDDTVLAFTNGTDKLQQCFNVTIVDDQLVEQQEVFLLTATPSSGSPIPQFVFIESDDGKSKHYTN